MLFDAPLLPGLYFREELLSESQEAGLIEAIGRTELTPFRFQGWTGKRLTHTFGWSYDFDNRSFEQTEPLPDWLLGARAKVATLAGVAEAEFVHALVSRYDPGAPIGWHRDRPHFDIVAGISLESDATLRFRLREASGFRRASLFLPPRSAYVLSGEARSEWEHSIAPAESLRFSITFRTLSSKGLSAARAN